MSWWQETRGHLDDFVCSTHKDQVVSIYCQTCDVLICPKCITQGPSKSGHHNQHVYLDLDDAYLIKQKELNQVITNFKDATQTKKNERFELHAVGQKLKLELLRKKTAISKQTRCLHDAISRQEKNYIMHIETLLMPAIKRNELRFNDVDFEVVNREGALGSAESVSQIREEKSIQFLRAVKRIENDLVKLSANSGSVPGDGVPELQMVREQNLSLHQYKNLITRAFSVPCQVPNVPRVLLSWCTVGISSASISFKCPNNRLVQCYVIVCQPYSTYTEAKDQTDIVQTDIKQLKSVRFDLELIRRHKDKFSAGKFLPWSKHGRDSQVFSVKSRTGRMTAVIRNLRPHTLYIVQIHAINSCGSSQPVKLYLTTLDHSKVKDHGRVSLTDPSSQRSIWLFFRFLFQVSKYTLLMFLFFWAFYAMYISWGTVYEDGVYVVNQVCAFTSTVMLPYFSYLHMLLRSKLFGEYLSFLMLIDNASENSLVEETMTIDHPVHEVDTFENNKWNNWLLESAWEWMKRWRDNSTYVLF